MNASLQRHPWYEQCGNEVLYHHALTGASDAIRYWSGNNEQYEFSQNFKAGHSTYHILNSYVRKAIKKPNTLGHGIFELLIKILEDKLLCSVLIKSKF